MTRTAPPTDVLASIVVPTRGGRERLPVLLSSLERQTQPAFEVIVVCDGDVDGSAEVVGEWTDRLQVSCIVFPENRGRSAALNAGFAAATGQVLIRCDDDLECEPTFVERHVRLHEEGRHGVIAMCTDAFPDTPYARAYGIPADERIRRAASSTPPDERWRWWSGNVSVTRDVYDEVGDYDERFRTYGWEDVDWGYRLHLLGVPIIVPEGFTTLHHGPVTTTRERGLRAFHSGAARETFVERHGRAAVDQAPQRASLWNALVAVAGLLGTGRTISLGGSLLDQLTPRLPQPVAEKLVALLVQGASRAGQRYPGRLRSRL